MTAHLDYKDIIAIVLYFVLLLAVYAFSLSKSNRSNTEGYFLAGRNMNWFLIGMSLFSTNIGAEHFVGLAGSGSVNGISAAAFEIHAMLIMQLLSWVFVPTLISAGVQTMPEFFSSRLDRSRIRVLLAIVYLILYILTKVSVNIYAGALFINVAFQWKITYAILGVLGLAALFTIGGGLASVMYTDTFMSALMLLGATILCVLAFKEVNLMPGLYERYLSAVTNETLLLNQTDPTNPLIDCGLPKRKAFQMLRNVKDSYMPWLGFLLGHTPSTIWYWCSDQMMVQRVMAAKSAAHARGGTLLTGFLKITPLFLMVFVGMISRALYVEQVGGIGSNFSNRAYPEIAIRILPSGLRGLHVAVMISALVSGLTSLFNSSSTLFTLDIYRLIRRNKASNLELMVVGRLFASCIIILAAAWIPIVMNIKSDIYTYIQSVNSFYASPIACIYMLAIFWPGLSEAGAFYGLLLGFTAGTIRMVLEFSRPATSCGHNSTQFSVVRNFNFMYFSLVNFIITGSTAFILSKLLFKPPDARKCIVGKTYSTRRTAIPIDSLSSMITTDKPITIPENNEEDESAATTNHKKNEFTTDDRDNQNGYAQVKGDADIFGSSQVLPDALSVIDENEQKPVWIKMMKSINVIFGKLVKLFCGLSMTSEDNSLSDSANDLFETNQQQQRRHYLETVSKFNEFSIKSTTRYILNTFLIMLALLVMLCYVVFSLDPSITFIYTNTSK